MRETAKSSVAALMVALALAAPTLSAQRPTPPTADKSAIATTLGDQPLSFEVNRGQADSRVRYLSRARDYTVALTDHEALLLVRKATSASGSRLQPSDVALMRMRLAGASKAPRITARDPQHGKVYYADATARGPLTPIDTFARVEYAGVYPGVDLIYYGNDRRLEFDFVVAPFADPNQIALSLEGAERITLTDAGDLSMHVGGTEVRLEKPFVYQERGERRVEIPGAYVLAANDTHTVRLRLGHYDPSLPLVVDPTWMSVFGSTSEDLMSGLVVDSAGNPRVLGMSFDPASFGFDQIDPGVLPPPNCFLTKFDATTGLSTYRILFQNTQTCGNLALSPNDIAYFTGFFFPNGFLNNQGTTVTAVDDTSGVPVIRRFVVGNYDSSAVGEGVSALAVNSHENVFLIGPCRLVGPGGPALELSGYNETREPSRDTFAEGCSVPNQGFSELYQPIITVVDSTGELLYGSFLSPGGLVTRYGLAADNTDRAFIVGAQSLNLSPTADAYRAACPAAGTRGFDACGYLMVLDTTTAGPSSLAYASYLWNTENVETTTVRLGPSGEVVIASEGRVFDDFPSNRPTTTFMWPYSLYPGLREGIQLARFDLDANLMPSQLQFGLVFDPSRAVAALAGQPVRDALADLRLFPSGAPAIASIAYTANSAPLGVVTTFSPSVDRLGEVWTHNLGTRSPAAFGVAAVSGGDLFLAGQVDRVGAQDSDVFVERIDAVDPGANQPPTVSIQGPFGGAVTTIYADSPSGSTLQLYAQATDPDGDPLTYSWTGPFTNNPVTTSEYLTASLAVGLQQTITVTVDDGHGNIASASRTIDVVGTPFINGTATPIDSTLNGLVFNYAPVTITPAGLLAGPSNTYLRSRLDQVPPVPSNLQAGSPPIYFDVSTDAVMALPIGVCIDTRGMSFASPSNIRLYHHQQSGQLGAWTDITSPGYPQGNQICGQSNSLGTFAIFYPQVPATAVQTIVGNGTLLGSIDGQGGNAADDYVDGPATSAALSYLHGGAFDAANNHVFISDGAYILRANLNNNTVARVAGNGVSSPGSLDGPGGDPRDDLVEAGHAFNTYVGFPTTLALSPTGDVVFYDANTCRIRRLDLAQGRLFAVAGNGVCGFSGDGFSAGLASISLRGQIVFDAAGNLFFSDPDNGRVRRIDALTNVIDTVVGDGTYGIPINGAPAISTINGPTGLAFDSHGHLLVTGGMHLLRVSTGADTLINGDSGETISIIGGCNTNCQVPFSGDGLPVSNPQVYLPGMGSLTVARNGTVIFDDYTRIRSIAPGLDGVVTGASDEIISTIGGYFDWNTQTQTTNFNGDTFSTQSLFGPFQAVFEDNQGRILVVDGNNYRVRRFGVAPPPVNPNGVDLAIAVSTTPDPVNTDASLRYFVIVTNNGPATATGATLTYTIPANAVFESAASPSGVVCTTPAAGSSGTVTCDFGTLPAGATNAVPILIKPQAAGSLSSSFTVSGAELDTNTADNTTTATVTVNLAAAIIEVFEIVTVTNTLGVLPSAMISLLETVVVSDTPSLLPSAMIGVSETITVTDTPQATVPNTPPAVNAGLDQVIEATATAGASVTLNGVATDADSDALTLAWSGTCGTSTSASVTLSCALGPHTMTFTADDGRGAVVSDTVAVIVRDTTPPALTVPADITTQGTSLSGAMVSFTATATDIASGPITPSCSPASGSTFAVGSTTVTCTATDAAGNSATGTFSVTVSAPPASTPTLQLPGNITVLAVNPAGVAVNYTATATDGFMPVTPFCSPASGAQFPIGTTTVFCAVFGIGTPVNGTFTVTVDVGVPSLTATIVSKGRDPNGSFWVELRFTNNGTGHARDVTVRNLKFRTLVGTGTVTYDAVRSGPLPTWLGSPDVGEWRTVRLYLNVPSTVRRFTISEHVGMLNVAAASLTQSFTQAVIP